MIYKDQPFDLAVAHNAVLRDTEGVLGSFLEGKIGRAHV